MEKLIYLLWKETGTAVADFNAALLGPVQRKLTALGAQRLQMHVVDDAVAPGAKLRLETMKPMPAAMVSFWLNAAHARDPYEPVLEEAAHADRRLCRVRIDRAADHRKRSPTASVCVAFSQIALFKQAARHHLRGVPAYLDARPDQSRA
jgi:hypothetical protein